MKILILGVCGTFMAGIARIVQQLGHEVLGFDKEFYPPMSLQLKELNVPVLSSEEEVNWQNIEEVIVGNAFSRGDPSLEMVLKHGIPYLSGPEWLYKNVLNRRQVIAVAGTHGKTTVSSMLTWILNQSGLNSGFLIGGLAPQLSYSANLGQGQYFVIEADEYDSAFYDKRSKFMHYRPSILIINNIEFDHADIFASLDEIKKQFHHLIRTVPPQGLIIVPQGNKTIDSVLQKGCWSKLESVSVGDSNLSGWQATLDEKDFYVIKHFGKEVGKLNWSLLGEHNIHNALVSLAAINYLGIDPKDALTVLNQFQGVKRRMEIIGRWKNAVFYDDFAHHPTAIRTTLAGLRKKIGSKTPLSVVLESSSYTLRNNFYGSELWDSLKIADNVYVLRSTNDKLEIPNSSHYFVNVEVEQLVHLLLSRLKDNEHVVLMSSRGFRGMREKLVSFCESL